VRIETIRIDGFGLFTDETIDGIPPGLSVFFGENEAGKTTLLSFIRSILFGFPTGRSKNKYEPLRGGDYGGSLTLVTDNAECFTVQRHRPARARAAGEVKVTCPDGTRAGEERLPGLLGLVTKDLFANVFAFSLSELEQLNVLEAEEVKGVIYSAGTGSTRTSLPELQRRLRGQMTEIFRPRGRCKTAPVLEQLDRACRRLRELAANADRYGELQRSLSNQEATIGRTESVRQELRLRLKRTERLLAAWDDWSQLVYLREQISAVPEVQSFPEDGLARLAVLEQRISDTTRRISACRQKLDARKEQLERICVDEALLAQKGRIAELQRGRDQYDSASRDLPLLIQQRNQKRSELARQLAALGPDWDREKLLSFDTSIPRRESIRGFVERLRDAQERERSLRSLMDADERMASEKQKRAEQARKAFESIPEPESKDPDQIESTIASLRQAQREAANAFRLADSLQKLQDRLTDQRQRLEEAKLRNERFSPDWPIWPVPVTLAGSAVAAYLLLDTWASAFLGCALAVALCVGYLMMRRWRVQERVESAQRLDREQRALLEVQRQVAELEEALELCKSKLRQIKGLPVEAQKLDEAVLEEELKRWEGLRSECERWVALRREYEQAKEDALDAARRLEESRARHLKAKRALQEVRREWASWLEDAGLSSDLTPEGAQEVLSAVAAARTIDENVASLDQRIELIERVVKEYSSNVAQLAAECKEALPDGADAGVFLDGLARRLQEAVEDSRRRSELLSQISELQEEQAALRSQLEEFKSEEDELFRAGGASDEKEFRQRGEWYLKRRELERRAEEAMGRLERIAGPGNLAKLESSLSRRSKEELQVELEGLQEQVERLDDELKEQLDVRGSIRKELEQIEADKESSQLRQQMREQVDKLSVLARQWSVLALARQVLAEAQQRYERERQPQVFREASQFFTRITAGRYERILAPPGESTVDVLTSQMRRQSIEQLSRGTLEQLFLSVRFGLIREVGRRSERLPVVMDDALVNFDPRRARAAAEAISQLAEDYQVLLFTCHPETRDAVLQAMPKAKVFLIEDGRVSQAV